MALREVTISITNGETEMPFWYGEDKLASMLAGNLLTYTLFDD